MLPIRPTQVLLNDMTALLSRIEASKDEQQVSAYGSVLTLFNFFENAVKKLPEAKLEFALGCLNSARPTDDVDLKFQVPGERAAECLHRLRHLHEQKIDVYINTGPISFNTDTGFQNIDGILKFNRPERAANHQPGDQYTYDLIEIVFQMYMQAQSPEFVQLAKPFVAAELHGITAEGWRNPSNSTPTFSTIFFMDVWIPYITLLNAIISKHTNL